MRQKNNIHKLFVDIIIKTGVLKNIPRMGWNMRGIKNCESVADHSFRVVLISMMLGDLLKEKIEINMELLLRMSVLHEIPESELTDIALKPLNLISPEIKQKAEIQGFKNIFAGYSESDEYLKIWLDFENGKSVEGKIVKIADKMEMIIQAFEYEKCGYKNLDDFWNNKKNFNDYDLELIKKIFDEIKKRHKKI